MAPSQWPKRVFLLCFWGMLCVLSNAYAEEDSHGMNVILIDITALRADHISSYGYPRAITPNIDAFARQSIVFKQAVSQAHWTLPSVTSVLTSLYVPSHAIDSRGEEVSREIPGAPGVLKDNGYRTIAFVSGLDLVIKYNLNQYFDMYTEVQGASAMGSLHEGFSQAIDWIRSNNDQKFFMFIQGYDVHPPFLFTEGYQRFFNKEYRGPLSGRELNYQLLKNVRDFRLKEGDRETTLTQDDIDYVVAAYDASVQRADKFFGDFIQQLRDSGTMNNTIVILFADHGEELHDHGSFDRFGSRNYFDEVLRVPLIMHDPRLSHREIRSQVELIDIMPTVFGLLDLVPKSSYLFEGADLEPLIRGEAHRGFKKYVYSGGLDGQYAVRTEDWKLIFSEGKFRLYHLAKDPKETTAVHDVPVATELAQKLYDWYLTTGLERFRRNAFQRVPVHLLPLQFRDPGPELWNR